MIIFISENGFKTNLILVLGITAFLIIGIDLNTELSLERHEIENVIGVLNETIYDSGLDILQIIDYALPFQGIIYTNSEYLHLSETIQFPSERGPPFFSVI